LVVGTSAINYLERLVPKMTCYVSSGTLNPTHSLIQISSIPCITSWTFRLLRV